MVDRISENSGEDSFNISTKVQMSGVLFKRPFGHQSSKWTRRFFVVKDGFLLYYPENERKIFERRGCFNIHPKGVIPLGGCTVEDVNEQGQQFAIHIRSEEFNTGYVALATENQYERDRWMQVLQQAGRITWQNTQLGETLIRELESQGLQLTREKQDYMDKLQEETNALQDEIDRNEELARVTRELDEEKRKLEQTVLQLKGEHEDFRRDYEETISAMKAVESEKVQLKQTTEMLQRSLEDLANERLRTLMALEQQKAENNKLSQTTEELQSDLKDIEEETRMILDEKSEIEQRFRENEMRAKMLADEKSIIYEHATTLKNTIQDLLAQKDLSDSELKVEIEAKLDAEKRLKAAEKSLLNLEMTLRQNASILEEDLQGQILPKVKTLKMFFESVAQEAKIDANKPVIMKNAVVARKLFVQRMKTQKLEESRKEKARTLGIVFPETPLNSSLRRSFSTMISNKHGNQSRPCLSLRRSTSTRLARISPIVKSAPVTPSTQEHKPLVPVEAPISPVKENGCCTVIRLGTEDETPVAPAVTSPKRAAAGSIFINGEEISPRRKLSSLSEKLD